MIKVLRDKLLSSINKVPEALKKWCIYYNDSEGNLHKKPISAITKRGGISHDKEDNLETFEEVVEIL